jgi:hypothetical protein
MTKRSYNRRSDEERISELNAKIEKLKMRLEMKQRKDTPVLKEMAKVQKALRKFAQTALDHGREDLANATTAFAAGLDRTLGIDPAGETPKRRARAPREAGSEGA